jgi:short subunit dehydrogenase-like uncharacterized protein
LTSPDAARWLLYGANGYTGELIARRAAELGMRPVLAGRDGDAVAALAAGLGLEHRAFPLTDPGAVRHGVADVDAVLHCAGPFIETSRPMVAACLDTATHYLDITGEIPVFEAVLGRGEAARRAGAVLLPGVGFDVVPTDCTAARLARAMPDARELELAFVSDGALSRGTTRTMINSLPHLGAVRRDGRIVPVPAAWEAQHLELPLPGGGTLRRWVMTIPWGDVSTAFHTTGIPNIRVYTGTPPKTIRRLRRLRPLLPLLGWAPVKALLLRLAERRFAERRGPDAAARQSGRVHVWGRATAADGRSAVASLTAPEGYELTVRAALECLRRVLAGDAEPGAHTPAGVFGPELVESIEGVVLGELVLSGG